MTTAPSTPAVSAILCADWGKDTRKRSVYVADVAARAVRRLPAERWSFARVLQEAGQWTSTGAVLAGFDAPLGVPESYLAATRTMVAVEPLETFLDLLVRVGAVPQFFNVTSASHRWRVEQPFFAVPAGAGGLRSCIEAAARLRVDLYRRIDRITGAKAVFITSGVPGSVGSGACALWQELAPRLTGRRTFRVWPFEGSLSALVRSTPVVVGEIYPRAAYATALLDSAPASRPPLIVGKTDRGIREAALAVLRAARWVREHDVTIAHLAEAAANEDDFDACLTATALLRCVLDGSPLCPPRLEAGASEGGILGTGSVNFHLPARRFTGLGASDGAVRRDPDAPE